ncbi:MAG TPA: thioredoxin domain-containing protein [Negativicutes bacterium]|nr:thioredoxin domain-containing protein [Negativicutes bacterium]
MEQESVLKNWKVVGGIIVAIAALFAFIYFTAEKPVVLVEPDIASVKTEGSPVIGSADAPVAVAYWSDYQCTYCKKFEAEVVSRIIADYVDAGKVKIIFKDFAFLGPDSTTAALAGRAVWEISPEKFAGWHKAMHEKQDAENSGWGNRADILALTQEVGIDSVKVGELMDAKAAEYQKAIDADQREGAAFGIGGTPSVIIGKQLVYGFSSYEKLKPLIEAELGK